MKAKFDDGGPWLLYPNSRTGRTEVFVTIKNQEYLVGSMMGDPTDEQIREMFRKLEAEVVV